jgi:hypothetical protein
VEPISKAIAAVKFAPLRNTRHPPSLIPRWGIDGSPFRSLPGDQPASWQFRILGADGRPVTAFEPEQTKLMHFYLIRSDLTGFQHIHPSMSPGGTSAGQDMH